MRKHCWLLMALFVAGACSEVDTKSKSCKISCSSDPDCPSGLTCGDLGLCAAAGETCSCMSGEFISCDADSALYCDTAATGITREACGAPGCNADEQRCNACVADATACSADLTTLDRCGGDGLVAESTTCAAGCIAGAAALDDDRCGYVQPAWLPDVCDEPATMAVATLSGALNVQNDAACSGGVRDVNGTTFCLIRASTITINDLKVTGTRAIAFVADDELKVTGILDVSADGSTAGPGAGIVGAGSATINSNYKGGGGAGFTQAGGVGGGNETATEAGMAGGGVTTRATTDRFVGGASTASALCGNGTIGCLNSIDFPGGGGGGGALLIACRGTIDVAGTVDAGGGGGTGGGDHYPAAGTASAPGGAPGGGSGGFVVFQGVHVTITGKLYANGGGGGAGCAGDNCRGLPGSDGLRSTSGAPGGDSAGNTCGGGIGGSTSNAPGTGENTFSNASAGAGGGGGSMGRFLAFTPSGQPPMLSPMQASPNPEASTTSLLIE